MPEKPCCDLKTERFHLINNLFSVKFCRTFEITLYVDFKNNNPKTVIGKSEKHKTIELYSHFLKTQVKK